MAGSFFRPAWAAAVLSLAAAPCARATWSIVIADSETREVAVGTVTCLTSYDLLAIVPVVVVGKGGAAVQAAGDFAGIRRPVVFDNLIQGTSPEDILAILAGISGHQSRQYGIADTQGRMVTFTGSATSQWAGGVIGTDGTMVYAIQGNILAGDCVVPAIEQAVLNTVGDIPAKLMAGMEAARANAGDGRCSCSPGNPTGCGCPPATFDKSGHIGTMVVARLGDSDDPICNSAGCADGDYFVKFNVPFQDWGDPDPVFQLQEMFDAWRIALVGRPDGLRSLVVVETLPPFPDGTIETTLDITPLDWGGEPVEVAIQAVAVEHSDEGDGQSIIGPVTDNGDGTYTVILTACETTAGTDRFVVTIDDGVRPVVISPLPTVQYFGDGVPPTPDPMTFASPPAVVSETEVTMTASEATDENLPVGYFFYCYQTGSSGGDSSGWREDPPYSTPRTYVDDGLAPNTVFTYRVKARDGVCPRPNQTAYSAAASVATYIETPTAVTFGTITATSVDVITEGDDLTNLFDGQSAVYFESTDPGVGGLEEWIRPILPWLDPADTASGLSAGTWYVFRVKARNQDGVEKPEPEVWSPPAYARTAGDRPCDGGRLGDMNEDGVIDGNDIAGFIRAYLGESPEYPENPACADGHTIEQFVLDLLGD